MKKIPIRLKKSPILEAVWEVRFKSKIQSISEILPGIIYSELKETYSKINKLPQSNIPQVIIENDPKFKYTPLVRLEGENYSIQIGDMVVAVSCQRPYPGWKEFGKEINKVATKLKSSGLLTTPERFSLKYIDILQTNLNNNLNLLNANFKMASYDLNDMPTQVRTEITQPPYVHIVQVAHPTEARLSSGESFNGVLLDIDTIFSDINVDKFWSDFETNLENLHQASKDVFFKMLNKDTIDFFEPEYKNE